MIAACRTVMPSVVHVTESVREQSAINGPKHLGASRGDNQDIDRR